MAIRAPDGANNPVAFSKNLAATSCRALAVLATSES